MKPSELLLRSYANEYNGQWQAFCIDFGLAAQGDSLEDVRDKLGSMIKEYVNDALTGEDKEYADQLLRRKAPFKQVATYYIYLFEDKVKRCFGLFGSAHKLFKIPMPLVLQNNIH